MDYHDNGRAVSIRDTDPLSLIPHGDRLLVEVLLVDETTAGGIHLARTNDSGAETDMGWAVGLVVNVGNGHRLDTPDQAVALSSTEKGPGGLVVMVDPDVNAQPNTVVMVPSTVPMPFVRGMVVLLAKYSGSELKFHDRTFRVITQAHVLAVFSNVKMNVEGRYAPQEADDHVEAIA